MKPNKCSSVTDCGLGIPAENGELPFDAFFHNQIQRHGLGAAVDCVRLSKGHGGGMDHGKKYPMAPTFQLPCERQKTGAYLARYPALLR